MLLALLATAALHGAIDPQRLSADIKILASDAFEGRGPGTAGERKTVDYLIRQFKAAGAVPAGENGGWTQAVEMQRMTLSDARTVRFDSANPQCRLEASAETILWTRNPAPRVDLRNVPIVFAGYGINAPDKGFENFEGSDLSGKLVLVFTNDPDWARDDGPFGGKRMSYYARLGAKGDEAGKRGAAAVLAIHDDASTEYDWPTAKNLLSGPASGVPGSDASRVKVSGYLSNATARKLLACAGLDLDAERKAAEQPGYRARELKGVSFTAAFDVAVTRTLTHNVLAKIVGTKFPDEYFAYTAHWDHLGRGKPDRTGDDIYNGALDNAGGTAGLLELARAFGRGPRPQRSILFGAMTLEESGLLGSEYYASHPTVPLAKIAGGFNMDAVNLIGMTKTMEVTSMGQTTLEDHLQRELAKQGRAMKDDPNSAVGFYYRSDHFPFAKRGVPFIFAGSGWELAPEKVPNTREPEVGTRYHQPSDEWSPALDFKAAARDIALYYRVGKAVANSREWPRWKPGTEFKAVREESDAARR
jgi:Zn-dependent M28 family amino/carboxypeptidase